MNTAVKHTGRSRL